MPVRQPAITPSNHPGNGLSDEDALSKPKSHFRLLVKPAWSFWHQPPRRS